ncbi:MAG TPA: RNA polymerase factor sigma-32 [Bdellovibrionales bacterium]|nr:RNA polymerase factor sigma-32 [Bdellovibrionales bacterium]
MKKKASPAKKAASSGTAKQSSAKAAKAKKAPIQAGTAKPSALKARKAARPKAVVGAEPDTASPEAVEPEILEPQVLEPEVIGPGESVEPEIVTDADTSETRATASDKSLTISDPLTAYLNEIKKYQVLSPEEERKYAIQYYETKDPKAAEKLVTSNLRFVVKVAAEYSKFGARMIDLVQEGNVGLMHAVREFNPYKGVRLITYAVWWIRGYIQEYLMRQYSLVRIGTTQAQRKLFYQLKQERKKLEAMGIEPGVALLSSRLGVSEEDVEMMSNRMSNRDVSLNAPVDEDGKTHLIDLQASPADEAPIDERLGMLEEVEQLKGKIEEIRGQLNEKEKFILEHRILADPPLTLQEIGEKYGMTRERARQLEARVISKIKNAYGAGDAKTEGD